MSTTLKISSFLIIFACLLSSCQDAVQVKLDQGSKLYVIDAFLTDLQEPQTIRISTNADYFSNQETPPVTTANVTLKDLSAGTQYTFAYSNDGNYIFVPDSATHMGHIGHQYQLTVIIDGINYTALATQKRASAIDSIKAVYEDGNSGFGTPKKPYYRCELVAMEPADNNPDYYWVKTFRNDTLFDKASDINLAVDGTGGVVTDYPHDSDGFSAPINYLEFKQYKAGDVCLVQIHSISQDTYNFLVQMVNQIDNGGLFATTPENVKTNVISPPGAKTKCVGWFSMATVVTQSKVVP